jgi:hypothetical protein
MSRDIPIDSDRARTYGCAMDQVRQTLDALIRERGADLAQLSKLMGRNPAYMQQFMRRGVPRRLGEDDRATLAQFFGVAESTLGGRERVPLPQGRAPARRGRLRAVNYYPDVAASAGPGAVIGDDGMVIAAEFPDAFLRSLAGDRAQLSMIHVTGDSMVPTLFDGDQIMVDNAARQLRDGIYVLRIDGAINVKRLARNPTTDDVTVKSDNIVYPSFTCRAGDIDVLGRVVWVGRKLV